MPRPLPTCRPLRGCRGRTTTLALAATLLMLAACGDDGPATRLSDTELDRASLDLADRYGDVRMLQEDGEYLFRIPSDPPYLLTPEQFARVVHREQEAQRDHGTLFVVLNITSWWGVLWVSVGLLGQVVFTFRMVLQWLASEKEHRSVVPVGFWWGSLLGGVMLLSYFIWRKDVVGILGQSTGAFIYIRNLWLIYFGNRAKPKKQPRDPSGRAGNSLATSHA